MSIHFTHQSAQETCFNQSKREAGGIKKHDSDYISSLDFRAATKKDICPRSGKPLADIASTTKC